MHDWQRADVELIKRLYATDGGRIALEYIMEHLGLLNGPSFAGDPYLTAFQEGRRFVARELLAAINLPVETIVKKEETHGRPRVLTATERAERTAAGQHYSPIRRR